jgi:hypothetical protein
MAFAAPLIKKWTDLPGNYLTGTTLASIYRNADYLLTSRTTIRPSMFRRPMPANTDTPLLAQCSFIAQQKDQWLR